MRSGSCLRPLPIMSCSLYCPRIPQVRAPFPIPTITFLVQAISPLLWLIVAASHTTSKVIYLQFLKKETKSSHFFA